MKLNKPFWSGEEELRISGFKSKTSINFNVNGVTKAVHAQTSLLSQARPEILTVVTAIVRLDKCLFLVLQSVVFHSCTAIHLLKICRHLFALDTAPCVQFK